MIFEQVQREIQTRARWYISLLLITISLGEIFANPSNIDEHLRSTSEVPEDLDSSEPEVIATIYNDPENAPILDMDHVIWYENQEPGEITRLKVVAGNSDLSRRGFQFRIDDRNEQEILDKFALWGSELRAKVSFDREERDTYIILIAIADYRMPMAIGFSNLTIIIGDENDNPMTGDGFSSIEVYLTGKEISNIHIGQVYFKDLDIWDRLDKHFALIGTNQYFDVINPSGMITMKPNVPNNTYILIFNVTEESEKIPRHSVNAYVKVNVYRISEDMISRSGSIRFSNMSAEKFIESDEFGMNKRTALMNELAHIMNISVEMLEVITVLNSSHHRDENVLDVRFLVLDNSSYSPEIFDYLISQHVNVIELAMEARINLINIDECLSERGPCKDSCQNYLNIHKDPTRIYTNTSSFVGITAVVDPLCTCYETGKPYFKPNHLSGIHFFGNQSAIFPPIGKTCEYSQLEVKVRSRTRNGLIFYYGPLSSNITQNIRDFMALEIKDGYFVLYLDYGDTTYKLTSTSPVADGILHTIEIIWSADDIEMKIDHRYNRPTTIGGINKYLNVNGPLQVGGSLTNLEKLGTALKWHHIPTDKRFKGDIRGLKIHGKIYNMTNPSLMLYVDSN